MSLVSCQLQLFLKDALHAKNEANPDRRDVSDRPGTVVREEEVEEIGTDSSGSENGYYQRLTLTLLA